MTKQVKIVSQDSEFGFLFVEPTGWDLPECNAKRFAANGEVIEGCEVIDEDGDCVAKIACLQNLQGKPGEVIEVRDDSLVWMGCVNNAYRVLYSVRSGRIQDHTSDFPAFEFGFNTVARSK